MKAYRISKFGFEHLDLVEVPIPKPGPGQVLIKVHAVSLNFRDLLVVRGIYNPKMALPRIPCSDGAGEVVEIGEGVTRLKPGQRVAGIFMQNWIEGPLTAGKSHRALGGDVDGMLAEYVVLDAEGVIAFPEHLNYAEAATLPCAAVTAWQALVHAAAIKAGDVVLIQGTGGVSIFALQFAKLLGARVLGTSSSDEKIAKAKAFGLDAAVNYREQPDWAKWVYEETGGIGVDAVVEVGGAGTFNQSLKAVRVCGTVAQIGVLSAPGEPISILPVLHKQIRVQGIYVGSRAMFEEMNRAIAQANLKPVIDHLFPFSEVREAMQHMASGAHFGKVVVRVAESK
ncbi:MAG: zinc-dependent alcohol dehydrogenase family protein [Acidobacteriaceae bacterium]